MANYLPRWLYNSNVGGKEAPESEGSDNYGVDGKADTGPEINVATEDSDETETTPKANASKANGAVPSLSLSEDVEEEKENRQTTKPTVPLFPAANSPQRASAMPPPPKPSLASQQKSPSSLMPPPARPTPAPRGPPPSQAASLRIPSNGPLPNRGPPANSQQRISSSLAPTAASTSNSRGKVLLKPGHSPMDWAALTRNPNSNLSSVSTFQRVTPSQLRQMTGRKGKPAWSSWQGKVYNITPYVDFHPGGGPEIMKAAGRDGEKLFMETHPWVNWENMLGACLVGVMVPEGYHDEQKKEESELEGLD